MGTTIWVLGFRVWDLGFMVWDLRVRVLGSKVGRAPATAVVVGGDTSWLPRSPTP